MPKSWCARLHFLFLKVCALLRLVERVTGKTGCLIVTRVQDHGLSKAFALERLTIGSKNAVTC
jgi:hypothetical protein